MATEANKPDPRQIARFADGELSSDEEIRFLNAMAGDPELARQVAFQKQLKAAVARAGNTAPQMTPANLRAKIEATLASNESCHVSGQSSTTGAARAANSAASMDEKTLMGDGDVAGRIGFNRWIPATVAAILLVAVTIMFTMSGSPSAGSSPVVELAQVKAFASRHDNCAHLGAEVKALGSDNLVISELPRTVEERTGAKAYQTLDLSKFGYKFWKAGKCNIPGQGAVHLLYSRTGDASGSEDSLSLWMVADNGQLNHIEPGKAYFATPVDAECPMIVWRDGGMIYYLMGDCDLTTMKNTTAGLLASASTSN